MAAFSFTVPADTLAQTHWVLKNNGIPTNDIRSISADPNQNIYAGTDCGMAFSNNQGSTWTVIVDGLNGLKVDISKISSQGNTFAVIKNSQAESLGIYRRSIANNPWVMVSDGLNSTTHVNNVNANLELLGNPFTVRYTSSRIYARNVWDMQAYNNLLYLGSGNSSNFSPSPNAGPVDVFYYNPASSQFINQYTVDEEQIDTYRIIDNQLYIPGHDPRVGAVGFYRQENGTWQGYNFSSFYHCYDIYRYLGNLVCTLGVSISGYPVRRSENNGVSWQNLTYVNENQTNDPTIYYDRMFCAFELNGTLYLQGRIVFFNDLEEAELALLMRYEGGTNAYIVDISTYRDNMFPSGTARIARPVNFLNKLVYIIATTVNDHQWDPIALMKADAIGDATTITLPANALPQDIIIKGDCCYVLGNIKIGDAQYINTVCVSRDLVQWKEILRFDADTFARSFEQLDGDFYFGLGCNTTPLPASTGNILRVKKEYAFRQPPVTALGVAPANGVYCATWRPDTADSVIYRSIDEGDHWQGVWQSDPNTTVSALAAFSVNSTTLTLAGLIDTSSTGKILRSLDNGANWQVVDLPPDGDAEIQAFAADSEDLLYAGGKGGDLSARLFRSNDLGVTWMNLQAALPANRGPIRAIHVTPGGGLFIGLGVLDSSMNDSLLGIYYSADHGQNWVDVSNGLTTRNTRALAALTTTTLFAGTSSGVFQLDITPPLVILSASTIAENQPAGTTVGTLSTTDPDTSGTFTYSLVSGAGDTDNTSFTISGDTLLTTTSFDYEAKASCSIRVRTTADADPDLFFEKMFTIGVTNVNEAPTVASFSKTVDFDSTFTFAAADFSVVFSDPDVGNSLQRVKIASLPAHGTLKLSGAAVTFNQEIDAGQLGNLTYTPNPGYAGSDAFTWNGSDGSLYAAAEASVYLEVNNISISVNPTAWAIGQQPLNYVGESGPYTITNDGNVDVDISVKAGDGAGGWLLGSARGPNTFKVETDAGDDGSYELTLQKVEQPFITQLVSSAAQALGLRYSAPTGDTIGGGPAQNFTITFTASLHVP